MVIFQWRCVKLRGNTPRNGRLQQGDLIPKCPNINQLLVVFSGGRLLVAVHHHLQLQLDITWSLPSPSPAAAAASASPSPSSYHPRIICLIPPTHPTKKKKKHHCHHPKKRKLPKISLPNHKSPTSLCVLFGATLDPQKLQPPGGPLHLASNSTLKRLFATEHAERRRRR